MPKKQPSAGSSKTSKRAPKRAGTTQFGRDIVEGLKAAVAFSRGEISLPVRIVKVPPPVDVGKIRAKSGLSQAEFAARYGFSHRTLQEWEQGRVKPDGATRAYLTVIDRNPQAVQAALSGRGSKVMRAGS
jgi:putative transcriptional regulator